MDTQILDRFMIKASAILGLLLLTALPARAQVPSATSDARPAAKYEAKLESGHALYRKGKTCLWTGSALASLGLLALVPVMHDGAFGITAADPGIGGTILALGGGFIHLGIPLLGFGAEREALATETLRPGFTQDASGWRAYTLSWRLISIGGGLLLIGFPIAIAGALDYEDESSPADLVGGALAISGLAVGGVGVLTQYYAGYLFYESHGETHRALEAPVSLSLQPVLRLGSRGSLAGGLALRAEF